MLRKLCNLTATCLVISLIFLSNNCLSQTLETDHFRSRANGLWSNKDIWESSHDSVIWENATSAPLVNSSSVIVLTEVKVGSVLSIDQIKILSSGKLISQYQFTVTDGPGVDLDVYGTLEVDKNIINNGQITIRNGALYQKNLLNNKAINICTWEDGSTIKLISSTETTAFNISNTGQSFYNFIWDGTTQAGTANLNMSSLTCIRGDLTIITSVQKEIIMLNSAESAIINISGDLVLNDKALLVLSSGNAALTLNVDGNIEINYPSAKLAVGKHQSNILNLKGDLIGNGTINGGIYQYGTLIFCNSLCQQTVTNNSTFSKIHYVLNPNVSVTFNNFSLSASYTLTLEDQASLILNPSGNNIATIKRTIPPADWSNPLDGWHLLSSPVQAQALNTGGFLSEPYDFYAWGETQNQWLNQKDITNGIAAFVPGKGYFVSYNEGGTKTFSGALNALNVTFNNLTITGSSPYTGFHLMGNPFPCSIDWNATGWTKTGIGTIAQIWSDEAGNYLPLTVANGIIPPEQGFFIQAVNSSNSFTIPLSARTHGNSMLNKETPVNFLQLRVTDTVTGKYDETVIMLSQDALPGFDPNDGHKLTGSESAPSLYTVVGTEEQLCVNALPASDYQDIIPLCFKPGTGNLYKLEAIINTLEGDTWLEDKKTGLTINLKENPLLWVSASESDPLQRFVIHPGILGKNEQPKTESLIYSYGKTIYFRNVTANSQYKLCTISGNQVSTGAVSPGVVSSLNLPHLSPGFYLISILSGSSVQTQKIFIQ